MENVVDALKISAASLLFIVAIASAFSLFGIAKKTADAIISMRDRQAYLEAAELDNGILYTSSESIASGAIFGVTINGHRIVGMEDVFSTIYRYAIENYSVTIINNQGKVIARYDTNLENYIKNYNSYGREFFSTYQSNIEENIKTSYCEEPKFENGIEDLYTTNRKYNISWLGNIENIYKRINLDISGEIGNINGIQYQGKNLTSELKDKKIVEVTNEIDNTKYLEDKEENGDSIQTDLPQQYNMPTIEIVYIIL